jgi:hypothetical protein
MNLCEKRTLVLIGEEVFHFFRLFYLQNSHVLGKEKENTAVDDQWQIAEKFAKLC